jgi:hypothetical protein
VKAMVDIAKEHEYTRKARGKPTKKTEYGLAAGWCGGQFDRTGNFKREYRISNNECRMSKAKPFEILRFDILLFCGSLFWLDEVSYKKSEYRMSKQIEPGSFTNDHELSN